MITQVLAVQSGDAHDAALCAAARALADGRLVVFPTETVYGVGVNAADRRALDVLSTLKSRTPDKPFTVHRADPAEADLYAGPLPAVARRLIRKSWPGPLTLVVPDRRPPDAPARIAIPEAVYHDGFVGLRCPDHAVGRTVLRIAGVPVVASSANLGGRPAPQSAREALVDLDGKVDLVLDAGPAPYARPSTVVRVRPDDTYEVLREGAITAHRLKRLAHTRILILCTGNLSRSPMAMGLARKIAAQRIGCRPDELPAHGLHIASAGTAAVDGLTASGHALVAARERDADLRDHTSHPMTVDSLRAADYIWVMTRGHAAAVRRFAPEAMERVDLLDPTGKDVDDPLGGDLDCYRACAKRLEAALVERLTETL